MTATTANHDPAELARFDRTAQRWWDPAGEFRPLHVLNPVRLAYVIERCGGLRGKRVLDIGCGGGLLSEAMALAGADVTGIDLAPATIEVAQLHALTTNLKINYVRQSAEEHAALTTEPYDVVVCMEMLEHVPEPASVLRAIRSLLRADGHAVLSTLNRNLKAFVLAIVGAEYVLNLLPKGTHTYERFIKPAELARWARTANLDVQGIAGLHYDALAQTAKQSEDVSVNYMMHLIAANRS